MKVKRVNMGMFYVMTILSVMFWLTIATAFAQTTEITQTEAAKTEIQETEKPTVLQPALADIKGITIGMTADEVKDKLGKAKSSDATGFYYVFSDEESMQITLDADKKVRVVAMFYIDDEAAAPKYEDIFGADAKVEKQGNGRIYNLVRYPDAGYWVAYDRIMVEDEPMITVTMQKMLQTTDSKQ